MAITYYISTVTGYVLFDLTNQEINISSDYDTLEVQEINDVIREAEASSIGSVFSRICDTSGKEELDTDTGVSVGITLELLDNWVIYSEKTSGVFKVYGGNLLRSDGADPFKANTLITYVVVQSAASTIVSISSGSGLSTEEHNRLFALPTKTLTDAQETQLETIEMEQLTEDRFTDLTFNRQNTIEGTETEKRITGYTAGTVSGGGEININVTYDSEDEYALPEIEEVGS